MIPIDQLRAAAPEAIAQVEQGAREVGRDWADRAWAQWPEIAITPLPPGCDPRAVLGALTTAAGAASPHALSIARVTLKCSTTVVVDALDPDNLGGYEPSSTERRWVAKLGAEAAEACEVRLLELLAGAP